MENNIKSLNTQEVLRTDNTYISNNCSNLFFYFSENREYDNPIIGALFVNDKDYVKFCVNFEHYMCVNPTFGFPRTDSLWAKQNGSPWYKHEEIQIGYPVMYLEDIEIHWIHEHNKEELLLKYNRRRERLVYERVLFLLSCSDLCNDHSELEYNSMIKTFLSIPRSVYLTRKIQDLYLNQKAVSEKRVKLITRWIGTDDSRNSSHILIIHTLGDRTLDFRNVVKEMTKLEV